MPAGCDNADRRVFALALALGAGGLIVASTAMTTAASAVLGRSRAPGTVVLAGVRFSYPAVNGAGLLLLTLATLGAFAVTLAAGACWRQRRQYLGLIAQLRPVERLHQDRRVRVFADRRPQAFCAGYLRPAVYVSQRTVELLSDAELSAVLAHEHHHRRVRDPLRLACVRILGDALFFVPILRPLSDRYADFAELSADRAAVRASGGEQAALASALLLFDESAPPGVSAISPERVDSLLGEPIGWRLSLGLLAASTGGLAALGLLVWELGGAASVHASLNLPLISAQPCLAVTMLAPFLACLRIVVPTARRMRLRLRARTVTARR
ncbi:MAG: M56 family metallopeptidase [Solirubrobacteraceae bacterium]